MKTRYSFCLCIAAILAVLLVPRPVHGQRVTNTIVGIVTDPSGAVVPGAEVSATNRLTGVSFLPVKTDANGYFVITELPEGEYVLRVAKDGFTTLERAGIMVSVDQTVKVDMQLKVGTTTQTVTVTGRTALVNTETAELSGYTDRREMIDLPLGFGTTGTSIFGLIPLAPGIQSMGNVSFGGSFSINGAIESSQTVTLDGANILQGYGEWYYQQPKAEELESIKVDTAGYNAEYGGIGHFNITSKGGTNQFHGQAQFGFTNNSLEARNTFATSISPMSNKGYGGTIGGPIIKDKLFFNFTMFRGKSVSPSPTFSSVPTAAMIQGDESAYPYQLYDPLTTCGAFGNPPCALNAQGQPIITRTPFVNNVITDRIDPVSAKLAAYWPTPNISGAGIVNNYTNEGSSVYNNTWDDQYYDPRIDLNIGQRNRIFGKWLRDYNLGHGGAPWPGPSAPGFGTYNLNDGWVLTIGDTYSLSATVVNEFRYSSNRSVGVTYNPGGGGHGFPDANIASAVGLQNVSQRDFPMMNLGGYASTNLGPCCGAYSIFGWLVNQVSDNLSIVRGRNTIKAGGGYGWQQNNWLSPGTPSGQFGFSGIFTKNLQSNDPGLGVADFLLGYANTVTVQPQGFDEGWRMPSAWLFVQDSIKVTPKFTVNLGLRDDIYWSPTEVYNRQANFSPTAINPATGTPGALVFAGVGGTPTRFADTTNNFAPRLGLAYSLNPKTVLRASAGMFYAETPVVGWTGWSGLDMDVTGYTAIPYEKTTTDQVTPAYSFCVPSATRTCPLGQQLTAPVPLTTPQLTGDIANGQGVNWIPNHVAAPVTYQWTMGFQRELPHDFFIEANYVGSRGLHLWFDRDINQVPDKDIGPGNLQSLRPYPQYLTLYTELNDGQSLYNALQLSMRRRVAKGLDLQASYTWSRDIDDSSLDVSEDFGGGSITTNVQDIYNLRAERAVSDRNHAQVFSAWAMYEVPSFIPGTVGKAISGGWQLNNIWEANSGPPITVFTSITDPALSGLVRPNRICNGNLSSPTLQEWFNTSCFTLPAPYSFGNSSRNPVTGPGMFTWDLSLFKNNYFHTKLNERTNIQIRAEFINFLNHPCYSNPNATIGSGATGVINSISVAPRAIDFGFRFIF